METMVKKVLAYMEEHLLDDVKVSEIAKHVYVSPFHLQRIFKALTGISLSKYIRNRRLSLAGLDVMQEDLSLLEIALKYQYDSLEGFSKAFYRFHGVNPSCARKEKVALKTYHPLRIQIQFEGGVSMDYKIMKMQEQKFLCVKKAFANQIIEEESNTEIPDFWTEKLGDKTVKRLQEHSQGQGLYGLCNAVDLESDSFYYGIGVPYQGEELEGFDLWEVNHPLYAVFTCKTMEDMGPTWKGIMEEFLPNSGYQIADATDFEFYPEGEDYFCEIWVPIQ